MVQTLKPFINGQYVLSQTQRYDEVHDPSTGELIARVPCCTREEVDQAIAAAQAAFPKWADTPPHKRAQCMFKLRNLIVEHFDELTMMVARENGKCWSEAAGDVQKAQEMTEFACGIPTLMMGEGLMNVSSGYDTSRYMEPLGVYAGLAPWNFPAMIPMGWMAPLAIACGNTYVLKAAPTTPMTCLRMAELYREAGIPDGVLNVITCAVEEAEILTTDPRIKGVTFVGSTATGEKVYANAAAHGKRVQALCEAKNHALVLRDAHITRTAAGIVNASFGCAGERCMALPVVVAEEAIADQLVAEIVRLCKQQKIGPAYDKTSKLGPVGNEKHRDRILKWIDKGVEEGAELILDGRHCTVPGYENGYYIGHTIFDHVKPGMSVGEREIFGPVLCIKRVKNFEEGLALMNANPFANGSVIYTQNGYYAREFVRRTDGGQVGVNVGIPVPMGVFSFTGHKKSFFGDLHAHGKDAIRFFTETKTVTQHWFTEEEAMQENVSTWDGTI